MSGNLTYSSLSASILEEMISEITHEIISRSILVEKVTREQYGTSKNPVYIDSTNPLLNSASNNGSQFPNVNFSENDNLPLSSLKKMSKQNSSSTSNNSSTMGTPQPAELQKMKDIGRFSYIRNGRDIYSNAAISRPNGSGSSLNGSSANGSSNGNGFSSSSGNATGSNGSGTSASELYFKCSNCDRKISGNRFAAHIDKCLGGRTRK